MNADLAELVLVVHFAIALFITAGFFLIPPGAAAGWRFVRRRWLRMLHAGAIIFVALESLAGVACPLTIWEDMLRGTTQYETAFIERWVRNLLYWDLPAAAFTAIYVVLALLSLALWRWVPPEK